MDIEIIKNSGEDSFVVDGAEISCSMGMSSGNLSVSTINKISFESKAQATVNDAVPFVNIKPFGSCKKSSPPPPCVPATNTWIMGKPDLSINGANALLKSSTCICTLGGVIKIDKDGQ